MGQQEPPAVDPAEIPEPGPDLERLLEAIERQVREHMGIGAPGAPLDGRKVLLLVACIRELLRDREALLEEIEALECGAGRLRST